MSFKNYMHRYYLLVCFLSLFLQCKKEELTDDTYFGEKIMILGHRGMGVNFVMPGNTWESIEPAIGIGADGCEIDIQLTKDTVLVLYHDESLSSQTKCNSRIYEMTWSEVKACEYHAVKNNVFVLSVEELFERLPNVTDYYFSFDCKLDSEVPDIILYQKQFLRAIKRVCEKYNMSNNVLIEGFQSFLQEAQNLGLSAKLFLGGVTQSNIDTAGKYSFFGLVAQYGSFETDADSAHVRGLYVMAYSPSNYYLNLSALRKKIDILQTDDPVSVLKYFDRYNYDYVMP